MICCEKCFKDIEIKAIINKLKIKGNCDTCNNQNVFIYDTSRDDQLVDNFNGLLEVYTPAGNLPDRFPKEKLNLLIHELYDRWNIFNIDKEKGYLLVKEICSEKYSESPELFDSPIGIAELIQDEYLASNSVVKTHKWEEFVEEIKTKNRFHTDFINTDVLNTFFDYIRTEYKKGEAFYRARISTKYGYPVSEMGAPPLGEASDGRANPLGISCLYLSNNKETTLHEIKAGTHDYVTVAGFKLLEDIEVIDFMALDKISPFSEISKTFYAINKEHLLKISNEIAKPLRRSDGPLDYIPTQYVVDFIKSKGNSGIKYKSTMNKIGFNLAIFNEGLFKGENTKVYDVETINYRFNPVDE